MRWAHDRDTNITFQHYDPRKTRLNQGVASQGGVGLTGVVLQWRVLIIVFVAADRVLQIAKGSPLVFVAVET